jgi:hypothetical protein
MVAGLSISWVYNLTQTPADWRQDLISKAPPIVLYALLMFARWRWLNVAILVLGLVGVGVQLAQP